MVHRSALGRVPFWELAFKNAVLPLLPTRVRRAFLPREEALATPWLASSFADRRDMSSRAAADLFYGGRIGHKYSDAIAAAITALPSSLPDRFAEEMVDLRHPFLHRPLVELALHFPPELCARPHARKWVLREAMNGILPEVVRTRVGKGGATGLIRRSLLRERQFLEELLRDPILAQLGCINARKLREALHAAAQERSIGDTLASRAHIALDIELWLQLRAGRWAATSSQDSSTQTVAVVR
jgi:hypothetical protein